MVLRHKENYAMRKLAVPKRVTLPNGRSFVARRMRCFVVCEELIGKGQHPEIDVEDNMVGG